MKERVLTLKEKYNLLLDFAEYCDEEPDGYKFEHWAKMFKGLTHREVSQFQKEN